MRHQALYWIALVIALSGTYGYCASPNDDLFAAVKAGYIEAVRASMERGANVNAKDEYGATPLHYAARLGELDIVQFLVERGSDVNARDGYEGTPLHKAAENLRLDIVQFLVEHGADLNAKDKGGEMPIHEAARGKKLCNITILVGGVLQQNHVYLGIREEELNIIQFLVERGADVKAKDNNGETLLDLVPYWEHPIITQLLMERGEDVKAKDKDGKTLLHLFIGWENLIVVQFLVEREADVNAKDKDGKTPLHYAAATNRSDIAGFLLGRGADVNAMDKNEETPLHATTQMDNDDVKMVELLLNHGAHVDARDHHGNTPLHHAARARLKVVGERPFEGGGMMHIWQDVQIVIKIKSVAILLSHGANVMSKNNFGHTPMHTAKKRPTSIDVFGFSLKTKKWQNPVMEALLRAYGATN